MSGVVKSVGKVFKSVTKVIKKVAPYVLAAAAIYFTAGAALGVAGTAGGWGAAVSSMTSQMGATGILGNVLTGAITQAGYGAAMGGATSLVTGGDIGKGITRGAVTGAVTGGAMGGLGMQTDPLAGIGEKAAGTAPVGAVENLGNLPPPGLDATAVEAGAREGLWAAPPSASSASVGGSAAPTSGASSGGLLSKGGWLERNQTLAGKAIGGVGEGLMNMAAGGDRKDAAELALERDREERAAIARNYGDASVPGYRQASAVPGQQTPSQRFDPRLYAGEYVYDAQQGRVVFVPQNATA